MAKEKAPVASAAPAEDRKRAIEAAMGQIEKMYGKGSIMRLGDQNNLQVDVIPTGSLSLDVALGVGGLPRGRIVAVSYTHLTVFRRGFHHGLGKACHGHRSLPAFL